MDLIKEYESLLQNLATNAKDDGAMNALRKLVITKGIPSQTSEEINSLNKCSLRGRIWKQLLGVGEISAKKYISLNEMGNNKLFSDKILNDTFRTFANDEKFTKRVSEQSIYRLLNAFVNEHSGESKVNVSTTQFSYVQGMNVLCAPLLYVMPELDAYYCFETLITQVMPAYVSKNLDGVKRGCQLFEECLMKVDPELGNHLSNANISPQIYAFAPILTLGACTPPLDSLLKIWDLYFACGFHIHILVQVAQLIMQRDILLQSDQKGGNRSNFLSGRKFLQQNPTTICNVTLPMVFRIGEELNCKLKSHMVK